MHIGRRYWNLLKFPREYNTTSAQRVKGEKTMEGRENLPARYERVLGRPFNEIDSEEPPGGGLQAGSSSSTRRREQVLNAQRTHRHRTQQYIRELEKEVFRLRDENDELQQAMQNMQIQMLKMRTALMEAEIPFEFDEILNSEGPEDKSPLASQPVSVDLTELANVVPQGACEGHPANIVPPVYQPRSILDSTSPQLPHDPAADVELTAQDGINFILALEKPCLPHVKHAHMGYTTNVTPPEIAYHSGPGHALNVSATLTHRYHDTDIENSALSLPTSEIQRLLQASVRLKLDGEVTPVQIWARLDEMNRRRGTGNSLTREAIGHLVLEFANYIYCNSFGAVVQETTVESILTAVMGTD